MSTTIDNAVLLPLPADWSGKLRWSLAWATEVESSLRGYESRGALRTMPRPSLEFRVDMRGEEAALLRESFAAALAVEHGVPGSNVHVGEVWVPVHGKALWADAWGEFGGPVTVAGNAWQRRIGDRLIALNGMNSWSVWRVTAISGGGNNTQFSVELTERTPGHLVTTETPVYPMMRGVLQPPKTGLQTWTAGALTLAVRGESWPLDGEWESTTCAALRGASRPVPPPWEQGWWPEYVAPAEGYEWHHYCLRVLEWDYVPGEGWDIDGRRVWRARGGVPDVELIELIEGFWWSPTGEQLSSMCEEQGWSTLGAPAFTLRLTVTFYRERQFVTRPRTPRTADVEDSLPNILLAEVLVS